MMRVDSDSTQPAFHFMNAAMQSAQLRGAEVVQLRMMAHLQACILDEFMLIAIDIMLINI